jgi:hypothetical protein
MPVFGGRVSVLENFHLQKSPPSIKMVTELPEECEWQEKVVNPGLLTPGLFQ